MATRQDGPVHEVRPTTQELKIPARFIPQPVLEPGHTYSSITDHISSIVLRKKMPMLWSVGLALSFLLVALWALKADSIDEDAPVSYSHLGAFVVTVVAFFLAEIGDKTQIATVMLAARFNNLVAVVAGTTLGMLIADVPVVLIGNLAANKIPFKAVRIVAAGLFAVLAVLTLVTN